MGNKLSKCQSNSSNSSKVSNIQRKNQSKFDEGPQSKFDGYVCQGCEERNLQIEYAPCQWAIDTSDKINIEYVCNQKLCKWFKT